MPFPPRYSELAWELVEAEHVAQVVPEVLRGFDPELVVYGLVGLARSVLECLVVCDFQFDAATIKGFHLDAHQEEYERKCGEQ